MGSLGQGRGVDLAREVGRGSMGWVRQSAPRRVAVSLWKWTTWLVWPAETQQGKPSGDATTRRRGWEAWDRDVGSTWHVRSGVDRWGGSGNHAPRRVAVSLLEMDNVAGLASGDAAGETQRRRNDAAGGGDGKPDVVRDDQHGHALVAQFPQHAAHLVAQLGVERARRFIHQQHLRTHGQCAGDGHALLLAAGELGRAMVGAVGQSQPCRGVPAPLPPPGPGFRRGYSAVLP